MESVETGYFTAWAGTSLFFRRRAGKEPVKGIVLIIHGYAGHGGRYEELSKYLSDEGWTCYAFDCRGHGESEGLRGYILRFRHYLYDLEKIVSFIRNREVQGEDPDAKQPPLVLFGHDTGAAIAAMFTAGNPTLVDALVVSSMYLVPGFPTQPLLRIAARILNFFVPTLGAYRFDVSGLSRDRSVIAAYRSDPLVYTGLLRVRTGLEITSNYKKVLDAAPGITVPVLVMHGTADTVAVPEPSSAFFELLGAENKTLTLYDGYYHELLNEPGGDRVALEVGEWLERQSL